MAETTRFLLRHGGIPYADGLGLLVLPPPPHASRPGPAAWGGLAVQDEVVWGRVFAERRARGEYPFDKVPVIFADGLPIAQSGSMARMAAKLAGCYPDDPVVCALNDAVFEMAQELCTINPMINCYTGRQFEQIRGWYFSELPRHLANIEAADAELPESASEITGYIKIRTKSQRRDVQASCLPASQFGEAFNELRVETSMSLEATEKLAADLGGEFGGRLAAVGPSMERSQTPAQLQMDGDASEHAIEEQSFGGVRWQFLSPAHMPAALTAPPIVASHSLALQVRRKGAARLIFAKNPGAEATRDAATRSRRRSAAPEMCPPAHAMCPPAQAEPTWRVEGEAGAWRAVVDAQERPEVELSEHSVRLGATGTAMSATLPLPAEACPVDVEGARCTYSRKRRQLVVEWRALAPTAGQKTGGGRAEVAAAEAPAAVAQVTDVASKEPPAREVPGSDEAGAVTVQEPPAPCGPDSLAAESVEATGANAEEPQVPEGVAAEAARAATQESPSPPKGQHCKAAGAVAEGASDDAELSVSAEECKSLGNAAVAAGDHGAAVEHYSRGLLAQPDHAILLSNRALCLHKLGQLQEALADATRCAALRPDFWKGHLRAALVLRDLKRPVEALELLRRAGKHEEIEKLSAELRPEAEAAEAERIAGLGGAERCKEEGNALFKRGLFEQALTKYGEALALCEGGDAGELAVSIRNNRAACYHQLSDFGSVVAETTAVLEQQPDNLKALARRMLALEPLEKHERALEDARRVLRHCPGHDAANRVQHRLGKLVRDLQREQGKGA
ncbi:unnamed protein product [Prorocentrum cordatum]|uniref:Uncharacterized protein n=1 Tax=Prorocentrum cordatum TaxID=2364126 RepID=A0ABN9WX36_9DINO|nr:unnamed protein product [Polarella glacialis]